MKVFTIGFTKKNAEQFFTRLKQPGFIRLVDARGSTTCPARGLHGADDLRFFLREINGID